MKEDAPLSGNTVDFVKIHQLVEGAEDFVPYKVLTQSVLQHFKVLHVVSITSEKEKESLRVVYPEDKGVNLGSTYHMNLEDKNVTISVIKV